MAQHYEPNGPLPATQPVDHVRLIELIGFDALAAITDSPFTAEFRDGDPVGVRIDMLHYWYLLVFHTGDDRYSVGLYRAMVPHEWRHDIAADDVRETVMALAQRAWNTNDDETP